MTIAPQPFGNFPKVYHPHFCKKTEPNHANIPALATVPNRNGLAGIGRVYAGLVGVQFDIGGVYGVSHPLASRKLLSVSR